MRSRVGQVQCPTCAPPVPVVHQARKSGLLELDVPPSANNLWEGMGHARKRTDRYNAWIDTGVVAALRDLEPARKPVIIQIEIHGGLGWNITRDADNVIKPIQDVLVRAKILEDDTTEFVLGGSWRFYPAVTAIEAQRPAHIRVRLVEAK